jgi:hypothetical protein
MDPDEERDFAGPPSDFELEEDIQILATLLKHITACIDATDIALLLQEIPVHPPVVIPARTMQEAVQANYLPPLDVDAANVFFQSDFSTFEPIDLIPGSVMQRAGVPTLYDSASNQLLPCLYICPVTNVHGRA